MGLVSEAVMVELGTVVRCGYSGGQGQGCSLYRIQGPGGGHRERGPDPDQPPDLVAEGASLGLHGPLHPQVPSH